MASKTYTGSAQNWKLSKKSDNSFAIMNAVTGYSIAMSDASASKTDGANVNLYKYSNANEKKFRIMYSGGYYRLVNVIVKTAAATMAQRWYLQ